MKRIDGIENIDGVEMLSFSPNFYPIIEGFRKVIGDDKIEEYLHEKFGYDASFNLNWETSGITDICRGFSQGWAVAEEQLDFIYHILNQIKIDSGYNYKTWSGKYEHIICK